MIWAVIVWYHAQMYLDRTVADNEGGKHVCDELVESELYDNLYYLKQKDPKLRAMALDDVKCKHLTLEQLARMPHWSPSLQQTPR
jgi:hypothetical protein